MEMQRKVVLVMGAAKSGLESARFLAKEGAFVYLNDLKEKSQFQPELLNSLEKMEIILLLGFQPNIDILELDFIVVSPGVPLSVPPLVKAKEKGIPILSEMELAARFCKAPLAVITGTNGKTTTTALLGQMFQDAGRDTFVGGNIGIPFITKAKTLSKESIAVLEASSFQLETTLKFKPRAAVILNITPDHLDRHGSLGGYIAAKAKIFANQDNEDWLILNADDPETRKLAGLASSKVIFFSRIHNLEEGVCLEKGCVTVKIAGKSVPIIKPEDIYIKGNHNLENAMAAVAVGYVLGLGAEEIASSLSSFQGVPHRLEHVLDINGVQYINDSKGTNPDASIKALEAYPNDIILIAGGKSKGSSFLSFAEKIKEKVKALVLVGQTAEEIKEAVISVGYQNYYEAKDFRDAVQKAGTLARPGEIVLLSPACASFDMFNSYEHRGEVFKQLVHELAEGS